MGVASANRASTLFVPDKKGGPVSQRTIERFGQGRPSPTATCLTTSNQTITPGPGITLDFVEITLDGLGIAGFGSLTPYSGGTSILLGNGISTIYLELFAFTFAAGDQWTLTVAGTNPQSNEALGTFLNLSTTVSYTHAPINNISMVLPPVVVGGWQPRANGAPATATINLNLVYQGTQSAVTVQGSAVISRVS